MGNQNSKTFSFSSQRQMNNDTCPEEYQQTKDPPIKPIPINNNKAKIETQDISNCVSKPLNSIEMAEMASLLERARQSIDEKNRTIEELQRELDKLKSVLDQTYVSNSDHEMESIKMSPLRFKRLGVSGESPNKEIKNELVRCPKNAEIKKIIRDAIMQNMLLCKLDPAQVNEIIDCMHERHTMENCFVIKEGDEGQHLYVAQSGQFEIYKDGKLIGRMDGKKCFGEVALLYNCKRTASVKALSNATLWVLERGIFQTIMMKTSLERQQDLKKFLNSVPLFSNLPERKIMKIVELVEQINYSDGQCIIRQGEAADSFFIIQSGWVRVTQKLNDMEVDVREMTVGDYFGEKALLEEGTRTASIYATKGDTEVLCLYRQGFTELIGELNEIHTKEYDDEARAHGYSVQNSINQDLSLSRSLPTISFQDIEITNTLGIGGFGRVELVINKKEPLKSYAMKCMKKDYIVKTKQQEHVLSEKKILLECNSAFICRLYATFHDTKFVYLLMEVCLGGELWTFLRDKIHFDDPTTLFCLACVIEAIDYLHCRGIVYRDLKPENLLISQTGYIKLCDFGFAKKIGLGKRTWTFCGTPEYVAPEIILNKGHDFAVDYWSIGILTFELLNGSPPFVANDAMKIYNQTLRGVEAANIFHNRKIILKAACFIQKLCRFQAIERLGNGANGINEIKAHKYFQGFDWDNLKALTLKSPFNPKISHPGDVSHFDKYPKDPELPPDEISGWDKSF